MRVSVVKSRLRAARKVWETDRLTRDATEDQGFIAGVLRGFKEALDIVQRVQKEEIARRRIDRQPISRWNALLLYKACRSAYSRLKQSDRASAMRILSSALSRITLL